MANVEDLFGGEEEVKVGEETSPANNAAKEFYAKKAKESQFFPKEPGVYKCKLLSIDNAMASWGPTLEFKFQMADGTIKKLGSGSTKLAPLADMIGATVIIKASIGQNGKTAYSL